MAGKPGFVRLDIFVISFAIALFYCTIVSGATLHVSGDGHATIQDAIDAASNGDTVMVADGTYRGMGNKNLDFKGKAIVVKSENGPRNCVIDCEGEGRGFYFHSWEGKVSTVAGFTITNGHVKYDSGGGIYCYRSSPTVTNCKIMACTAESGGGGVYCTRFSYPTFINCTITGNSSGKGGGVYCSLSSPSFTSCIITGNSTTAGSGGGIYCFLSSITLVRCTISNNSADSNGGGICLRSSHPLVTGCTISKNRANNHGRGGGIYCLSSSSGFTNCTVTSNWAKSGAGIYCSWSSSPSFTNCTFTGNRATERGGAIYCSGSSPTIINTILWGDKPEEIYMDGPGAPEVKYSDIQGSFTGPGNIDADPLFVGKRDYHLGASSPCLDKGDSSARKLPLTDKDGNTRIINAVVDMGAFELMPYSLSATGKTLIRHPDGASIPVIRNALKGHLAVASAKGDRIRLAGWAADARRSRLPEAVLVFLDGQFFFSGKTERERPDVAKFLKNPALKRTGFDFRLLFPLLEYNPNPELRFFAVSKKGVASELIYPKGYKWGKK